MKKALIRSVLFVFGLLLCLLPSPGDAFTLTVNCDKGQHIQSLFGIVPLMDITIIVKGTCNENVLIDEKNVNITLNGGGTATIHGPNPSSNTLAVNGRGIVIQGFYITGGYNGIQVRRGGTAIIDSNTIHDTNNHGIVVSDGGFATIINNTIRYNASNGIEVHDTAGAHIGFNQYSDTVTQANTVQNNGNQGINVQRSAIATVVGNYIENNYKNGILVQKNSHADISGNHINGNGLITGANGIRVQDGSGVNLGNSTGSTIYDLPNYTTAKNGNVGISCNLLGYADGLLGSLSGIYGQKGISITCLDNLQ